MRLFIAADLENEDYFRDIQKQINDKDAKINLTKTYHLTLKFLGEVEENKVDVIKNLLNKVEFKAFKIKTTEIGVFSNKDHIRVVWVGLEPEEKIIELQKMVNDSLKENFKPEKDFKVHVTLARVKFVENKEAFVSSLNNIKIEKKEFLIDKIKLIKSTLTSDGPIYENVTFLKGP